MELLDKKFGLYLLDDETFEFPKFEMMKDDLVAVGGDFHPQRFSKCFMKGVFFLGLLMSIIIFIGLVQKKNGFKTRRYESIKKP